MPPPLEEVIEPVSEPPLKSEVSRILDVFVAPQEAFADIVRKPRWWIPVILISIVATIFTVAYSRRVGFEQMIRQVLQGSQQAQSMPPAQMEAAIQRGAGIAQFFAYGGAVISIGLSVFVIAVVLMFLFDTIMGADIGLVRMLGIVAYGFLPTLVSYALALLVLYLKAPEDFNIQNPLAFNAAILVSSDAPLWMKSLAGSFDLFSFWIMTLMAVGVSAASRKIGFGKAFATILFPWAMYVALKTGALVLRG